MKKTLNTDSSPSAAVIKVCIHDECRKRGGQAIYEELSKVYPVGSKLVACGDCFRHCLSGPNVAVGRSILHHMQPKTARRRVQRELTLPQAKRDALGSRSLKELDAVLDELTGL